MQGSKLVLLVLTLICAIGKAEYRAFLLKISKTAPANTNEAPAPPATPATPDFRLVKSNLDPEQYVGYYPLSPSESISYIETWMCRGRTGDFQPVCDNPNAVREPAAAATAEPTK